MSASEELLALIEAAGNDAEASKCEDATCNEVGNENSDAGKASSGKRNKRSGSARRKTAEDSSPSGAEDTPGT